MVDEFIYQFQSFCQYRAKLKQRTDQELAFLRQFDKVWNVVGALNYLQALIEKSMILQILDEEKNANSISLPLMVTIIMVEQMCSKYWITSVLLVCCMCTACWGIIKVIFVHFHALILISLEYSILLLGARSPLSNIMDLQILCCEGIWIQSDPSTNSCTFSKPSSVTNGHHSMIELRRRISKCMLFLPSAYHSALIQNWLRSLFTTSCRRIMLRRCYTCNAVRKPCLMNFFSMPAPSSSPHPHPTMASPSSTLTRMHIGCS